MNKKGKMKKSISGKQQLKNICVCVCVCVCAFLRKFWQLWWVSLSQSPKFLEYRVLGIGQQLGNLASVETLQSEVWRHSPVLPHVHTCGYACVCVCLHMDICACVYTCRHVYIYMYVHFVDVCISRHRDKYGIETRYVIGCYKGYGNGSYQKKKKRKK